MNEQEKRRLAELETARARAGQNAAEIERDVIATVAVNEAIHRAAAEGAASEAAMRANHAELRERSMASASLSRQYAISERAAASNATLSTTLIAVVAVSLLLAIGYFAWWQPAHRTEASTNTFIRTDKTTEKAAAPPSVIVEQPDVNVKVVVPPAIPPLEVKAPLAETPAVTDSEQAPVVSSDGDSAKALENKPDNP